MTAFLLPADLDVEESWQWTTDILTARRGDESRLSLQPAPDVEQTISYNPADQTERRRFWINLAQDLDGPAIYPLMGWSSRVTAAAGSTSTTFQCDPVLMSLNAADYVFLLNPQTGAIVQGQVTGISGTTVTVAAQLGTAIDQAWIAYKGMRALLGQENRIRWGSVAGQVDIPMRSFEMPYVQRTGTGASLTSFNGTPVLEREALAGMEEGLDWPRDETDFGLGRFEVFSRRRVVQAGRRGLAFLVNRIDTADVDYWRLFLDTVRGSWKVFLLNSQLPDIALASALTQGGTTLVADQGGLGTLFLNHPSFASFEITYGDGTTSRHRATNVAGSTVTFTPALPSDPKVASVARISYLLRVRMADRLTWRHGATRSRISFDVTTTDNG